MRRASLKTEFDEATSLLELATRLGKVCLLDARRLTKVVGLEGVVPFSRELEATVAAMDQDLWLHPPGSSLGHLLQHAGLEEKIEFLEGHSPIEYLAVLRGLLPGLRRFYDEVEGEVWVESGTPMPIATRRVDELFNATPNPETRRLNDLLRLTNEEGEDFRPGFYIADFGLDDRIPVVLDFRHRHRIDELTWDKDGRLPRIATVHPYLGSHGIVIDEKTESTFFGVKPRKWDADRVVQQLRDVAGDAEIAVLPELSLPQADALEEALEADPGAFPPLVVAGSAHVTERGGDGERVRANESRIYLDGERIGSHRKIQAYLLKAIEGEDLPRPLREGITREEKPLRIYSGDRTRLAVAICADIIHSKIPNLLEEVGVNLLLVPSLTVKPGSFNGDACGIASKAQGVTVIVNGDSAALIEDKEPPFLVMVGVPRPNAGEQSRQYARPGGSRAPYTGLVDPNLPLRAENPEEEAFKWR